MGGGRFRISDFGFRIFGSRDGCPTNAPGWSCGARVSRAVCGGGAIFNIVGRTNPHVGGTLRADNVEGGSSRESRADTCAPTGRGDHTPQVNPLGQLDADGQSLPELEDPLAKVDIMRSTFVVSHLGQWTVDLSAPTGWRSENRSPHKVHLYS